LLSQAGLVVEVAENGEIAVAKALAHPETDEHGKTLELARLPSRIRSTTPDNDF